MDAGAPSAGILVIGDEILSGRTKDRNVGYIADVLTNAGVELREVRIVGDDEAAIVAALDALRHAYTYVFTTGGIGPTHDDITADAVGRAFGRPVDVDPRARAVLEAHYARTDRELNAARLRMARMPQGAELIDNPVSGAPGFRIGNVFVMAGVPAIMQAMMGALLPQLEGGARVMSETVEVSVGEGDIAEGLGELATRHRGVALGSYPFHDGQRFRTRIVARSRDAAALAKARADMEALARAHDLKEDDAMKRTA